MAIKHLIAIPLTGVGLSGGYRGDVWFKKRLEVFKNHTLKSLLNQKNKDFTVWFWMRPEEENNPIVHELGKYLDSTGLDYIFSFHGLLYWDDKFNEFSWRLVTRNILMMLASCWRNKTIPNPTQIIRHAFSDKNKTLPTRIASALAELPRWKSSWVYLTRIDSDDMFHRDAVDLIQASKPARKRALVFENGFVLNTKTGQLADWNPKTNPPFHTIIFPTATFFDPAKHLEYYGAFRSHESIPHVFKTVKLPDDKYCYVVNHGNISTYWEAQMYLVTTETGTNIGTRWNTSWLGKLWLKYKNPGLKITQAKHPFIGKEYHGKVKEKILSNFGL